jgi:sensor c-di-GMP phosphodiesterase-like protein
MVIEITERSLVAETARTAAVLTRLREAGFLVMLDDFGTGYSALSYLQSLPVDGIKIDKCFVDALSSPGAETPVLDAIIRLGRRLGMELVAEGVSSEVRRRGLINRGVRLSQGYLFARPMDGAALRVWMSHRVSGLPYGYNKEDKS